MSDVFAALRSSHDRLTGLAGGLTPERVTGRAYPAEWSIAQVFSHLGSGAEIMALALDAALAGTPAPGREANPPIWDRWNAKEPWRQVTEGVATDGGLVARFEELGVEHRASLRITSFVGKVSAEQLARLRLNEHAVHTWDIAVALDPSATIGPEAVPLVLDGLGMVVGFAGRGERPKTAVRVTTTDPDRVFTLSFEERVRLGPSSWHDSSASLALPAEAFIRLVYGRLDPAHTPPLTVTGVDLDDLRRVFPGF